MATAVMRDKMTAGAVAQLEALLSSIRGELDIDAVAFADGDTAAGKAAAEALIEEEMGRFAPSDYLASFADARVPPRLAEGTPIGADLSRVEARGAPPALRGPEPGPPPPGATPARAAEAWSAATAALRRRAEELTGQAVHVAIAEQYGADAWEAHVTDLRRQAGALRAGARDVAGASDAVNAMRKRDGASLAGRLARLRRRQEEAERSSAALERACAELEAKRPRPAEETD